MGCFLKARANFSQEVTQERVSQVPRTQEAKSRQRVSSETGHIREENLEFPDEKECTQGWKLGRGKATVTGGFPKPEDHLRAGQRQVLRNVPPFPDSSGTGDSSILSNKRHACLPASRCGL